MRLNVANCSKQTLLLFILILGTYTNVHGQDKNIQTSGDILVVAMPLTALTSSLIIGDKEGAWQFTKGAVLNQALTIGVKYATNKKRPYNNGDRAFPSGHTSTTFQSAAYIQKRYGWSYGIPAYILAGYTGYSRINAQKHDGWDVLAGAVVGIGSAYIFTSPYQKEHMELSFANDADSFALGFVYKF
jgi:membrane-associated phospholipid phosphatase